MSSKRSQYPWMQLDSDVEKQAVDHQSFQTQPDEPMADDACVAVMPEIRFYCEKHHHYVRVATSRQDDHKNDKARNWIRAKISRFISTLHLKGAGIPRSRLTVQHPQGQPPSYDGHQNMFLSSSQPCNSGVSRNSFAPNQRSPDLFSETSDGCDKEVDFSIKPFELEVGIATSVVELDSAYSGLEKPLPAIPQQRDSMSMNKLSVGVNNSQQASTSTSRSSSAHESDTTGYSQAHSLDTQLTEMSSLPSHYFPPKFDYTRSAFHGLNRIDCTARLENQKPEFSGDAAEFCVSPTGEAAENPFHNPKSIDPPRSPVSPSSPISMFGFDEQLLNGLRSLGEQENLEWQTTSSSDALAAGPGQAALNELALSEQYWSSQPTQEYRLPKRPVPTDWEEEEQRRPQRPLKIEVPSYQDQPYDEVLQHSSHSLDGSCESANLQDTRYDDFALDELLDQSVTLGNCGSNAPRDEPELSQPETFHPPKQHFASQTQPSMALSLSGFSTNFICRTDVKHGSSELPYELDVTPYESRAASSPSLKCEFCPAKFKGSKQNQRTNMQRHKRSVHNGKKINCPHCDKTFNRTDNYGAHLRKFHGEQSL